MPSKLVEDLSDLIRKEQFQTHHIRIKLAPEMFRFYSRRMDPATAKMLTCAILNITPAGFDMALRKDPIAELETYRRNQKILDLRCEGFSFEAIAKFAKLSRTQVWRILREFEEKTATVNAFSKIKVKKHRLTWPELELAKKRTGISPGP